MTQALLEPPCLALSSRSGSRRVTKSGRVIHSVVRSLWFHDDLLLIGIPRVLSVLSAMKVTTFSFPVDVSLQSSLDGIRDYCPGVWTYQESACSRRCVISVLLGPYFECVSRRLDQPGRPRSRDCSLKAHVPKPVSTVEECRIHHVVERGVRSSAHDR